MQQTATDAAATGRSKDKIEIIPVSEALGAEVRGVDLADVDAATLATIREAWLTHAVLLFRDQTLSDDQLADFSRHFGELDLAPPMETSQGPTHPEILVISNVKIEGKAIGTLGDGEAIWHSDMNYMEEPPTGSLLYSLEIPPAGGDTGFCNMYKALETLPADLRRRIEGLSIKHDSSTNSGGYLRLGSKPVTDVRECPGAVHGDHASGNGPQGALPRPSPLCLHHGVAGRGIREAAGRGLGARDEARIRLAPQVARGRRADVGQPLCHAPAGCVRSGGAPGHAPHPAQGQQADLRLREQVRQSTDGTSYPHPSGCGLL